jgi:hypothetical protein
MPRKSGLGRTFGLSGPTKWRRAAPATAEELRAAAGTVAFGRLIE